MAPLNEGEGAGCDVSLVGKVFLSRTALLA